MDTPPPYIRRSSLAYRYHRMMWRGRHSHGAACHLLHVPGNTGYKWRERLQHEVAEHTGIKMTYWGALRWLFDRERLEAEQKEVV